MEPQIEAVLGTYFQCGGDPETVVESLCENYSCMGQVNFKIIQQLIEAFYMTFGIDLHILIYSLYTLISAKICLLPITTRRKEVLF